MNIIYYKLVFLGVLAFFSTSKVRATITFTEEPKDAFIAEGSIARLNCSALTPFPLFQVPIYFWKLNGNFIQEKNTIGINLQSKTLVINSFSSKSHSGTYHCIAFHKDYGAIISKPAKLQAAYFQSWPSYNDTYTVRDASYVLINSSTTVQAQPAAKYSWFYKQNGSLQAFDTTKMFILADGSLLIPSVNTLYNTDLELYAQHPTLGSSYLLVSQVKLQVTGSSNNCPNGNIIFLQNNNNKVINEGQDAALECLAVAIRCRKNVQISWLYNGQNVGSGRKLVLKNVLKTLEGSYTCLAKVGSRTPNTRLFTVTVKEKPAVVIPIIKALDISIAQTIRYGMVTGFKKIEWYTNGEKITSANNLFQVDSNWNLKVRHPNPSITGIYQIFFFNDAGVTVQSFMLYVDAKSGYGSKVTGKSGTVNFNPTSGQTSSTLYGSWLIQVPSTEPVLVSVYSPPRCSADGITALNVYHGSTAAGSLIGQYCSSGSETYSIEIKGPFITLVLATRNLSASGFTVHYSVKSLVTTPQPSNTPQIVSSKPSSPSQWTSKSSSKWTIIYTTSKSPTSTKQTLKSTVGGVTDNTKGSKSPVGAIVGAVVGVLFIAAIVIGVFCYRRRYGKTNTGAENGKSGKDASIPSGFENTYMRPAFETNDRNANKAPRFTVQARPMPDVVPSYHIQDDPSPYEMGYLGPEDQSAENQTYATVGEVIGSAPPPIIANQAYLAARSPRQNMGGIIPSAPGLPYSKSLTPRPSERPRDLPLPKLPGQRPSFRPSTTDDDDYLSPIDAKRLPSPTDSNYSKASSNLSGPQYQVLEMGENVTYESADDVINNMEKLDNMTRNPSDRSENRYAALHDDQWASKENSVYEPLTLGRDASSLKDIEDGYKGQISSHNTPKPMRNAAANQKVPYPKEPTHNPDLDDDYSDPYEPNLDILASVGDDYSEPYESANQKPEDDSTDNVYEPLTDDADHRKLQGQHSNKYTTLDGTEINPDAMRSQPLHLQDEDNDYAEI